MILQLQNFYNPYPRFLDTNGNPLDGGSYLLFCEAGTSTPKAIYTDSSLTIEAQNPQPLALGFPEDGQLFYGSGAYKVFCYDQDGVQVWFADNVQGTLSDDTTLISFGVLANITALRNATPAYVGTALVLDYNTNDRGGGLFEWDALSTAPDDGGSVIRPSTLPATGRWIRKFQGQSGVLGDQFGVVPDGSSVEGFLGSANTYCDANSLSLTLRGGTYTLSASANLNGDYPLIIDGASFTSSVGATLTLATSGLTITQISPIRLATLNLVILSKIEWVSPVWWGAVGDGTTDCYSAFTRLTGRHNAPVLIDRPFKVTAVGAPSIDLIVLFGAIFDLGGSIEVTYTDADKFQIGPITSQKKAYNGIKGADLVVYTFVDRVVPARLFFDISPSLGRIILETSILDQIILSHAGLSLLFDGYDFQHNASVGSWTNPCIIESGVVIYSTGIRTFGYVQASPTQVCFALGVGGISLAPANKKLYGAWYGVLGGLSTDAFNFLTASDGDKIVDFDGASFSVSLDSNSSRVCNFENGSIDSVGTGYLLFGGGSEIKNFTLSGNISYRSGSLNKFNLCTFNSFTKGDFSGDPVNARFVNCEFNSDMNFRGDSDTSLLRLDGDQMTFIGCTINGLLSMYQRVFGSQSLNIFGGCFFNHDDLSTVEDTQFINSRISNSYFSDSTFFKLKQNCSLIGCYARATDPDGVAKNELRLYNTASELSEMGVSILGCHLSNLEIRGAYLSDPDTIVRGVQITGNFFDPIGISTPYDALRVVSGSNLAPSGHDCQIVNNTAKNGIGNLGSTCGTLTIKLGSGNREALDSSKVILPKNTTDSSNFDVNQFYFKAT
jgi:hypothetical protein